MLRISLIFGLCFISQTLSSIIDVFEATNGHEPRVAIRCGSVPFYVDLETGAWVADSDGTASCDKDKSDVKRYCQKTYPKLNISNIVEANKPVKFNNWCRPGQSQCSEEKRVVPYRCLVNEYEADALMVPDGCKFDHLHDQELCLTHGQWKKKAASECKRKHTMKLRDYGILLSCDVDYFTGVEFVCCPKKSHKKKVHHKKEKKIHRKVDREAFSAAIKNFQAYLPLETKGCDRSTHITKQTALEDRHRKQIAAVVDEWDEAEKRYNKLKVKDPVAAEEKMKRTLEVFRQTLAALEQESKEEKDRLRVEHAECINTQISKNKRDAMVAYLAAIEEKPVNAESILKTVRTFIQVCEHDRVHSLRHFEHVRNRDAQKAETIRGELLQHLKDLNKVVNESMALLNYLPEIAEQFGITGTIGGAVLKPRLTMPKVPVEEHTHERVVDILESAKSYGEETKTPQQGGTPRIPTDDIPVEPQPVSRVTPSMPFDEVEDVQVGPQPVSRVSKPIDETRFAKNEINHYLEEEKEEEMDDAEDAEKELGKMEKTEKEILAELKKQEEEKEKEMDDAEDAEKELGKMEKTEKELLAELKKNDKMDKDHDHKRSPFAFNAVMGLSCGVLVIMLFVVIAVVMRRRRLTRTRVVLAENNDDREHLVQMQKNGFENPTYKFYYY